VTLKLGLQIEPHFGFSYEQARAIACDAEQQGFAGFWVSDHFYLDPRTPLVSAIDAWTLLAALARETSRIRLGTLVTSQSYRHPSLLAKIATSVDHLSDGRLDFGIGAGARETEYQAYGYPFPTAGERVGQLADAVEIIRLMWTEDRATYHGRFYSVDGAPCAPKPVQKPHPPIWIGGSKPRMLRIAARHADALNPLNFWSSPDQYANVIAEFRAVCHELGRDDRQVRKSHCTYAVVAETRAEVDSIDAELRQSGWRGATAEAWTNRRDGSFIGTPDEVVARLKAFEAAGVDYVILQFAYGHERKMIELAGRELIPAL
jgi:F420-dependent oxidoreductase-like protein